MRHSIRFSFHFTYSRACTRRIEEHSAVSFRGTPNPSHWVFSQMRKGKPPRAISSRRRRRLLTEHEAGCASLHPPPWLLSHLSCFLHPLVAVTRAEKRRRVFLPDYLPRILKPESVTIASIDNLREISELHFRANFRTVCRPWLSLLLKIIIGLTCLGQFGIYRDSSFAF